MEDVRVIIRLTIEERDALVFMAKRERRDPRVQCAILVRRALEQAGVLTPAMIKPLRR